MNDFDTTIPHSRFSKSDNVELHGLGSSINCLGRRVASYATRDAKEIAKLLAKVHEYGRRTASNRVPGVVTTPPSASGAGGGIRRA